MKTDPRAIALTFKLSLEQRIEFQEQDMPATTGFGLAVPKEEGQAQSFDPGMIEHVIYRRRHRGLKAAENAGYKLAWQMRGRFGREIPLKAMWRKEPKPLTPDHFERGPRIVESIKRFLAGPEIVARFSVWPAR